MTAVAFWAVVAVVAFLWALGRMQGGRRWWNGTPALIVVAVVAVVALLAAGAVFSAVR